MGTKAKGTAATGGADTAEVAVDLTRHEADAEITVVEDAKGRKTVRGRAAFDYTIERGEDGRWASGGDPSRRQGGGGEGRQRRLAPDPRLRGAERRARPRQPGH